MDAKKAQVRQGTPDLMAVKTLPALGLRHGFGIARRIEQVSRDVLQLNEGTVYTSRLRLQQQGWIAAKWGTSQNEILFHHQARAEAARIGNRKLGAHRQRDWPRAAAEGGKRILSGRQR